MRRPGLLLLPMLLLARAVRAQNCQTPNGSTGTCSITVNSSLTIPTIVRLTVTDTIALTAPTLAIYSTGSVVTTGPLAVIRSNTTWSLSVAANSATWTATGPGARLTKPASDLLWSTSSGGTFTPMSTTAASITSGSRGSSSSTQLYYKTLWDITLDGPGAYALTLVYSVTAP